MIRGIYYDNWEPSRVPVKEKRKEDFLNGISRYFETDPTVDPEQVARTVFKLLYRRISEGEIKDIMSLLPKELYELWPEPVRPKILSKS